MLMKKVKSNTGASLSMALLLFLVCAVIGIVVLTAATASAGRASKLAEMDGRYYSVASAAELLAQELSDKSVTIVREKTTVTTTTTVYTVTETTDPVTKLITEDTVVTGPTTSSDASYLTRVGSVDYTTEMSPLAADTSFLTSQAIYLMFGSSSCNTESAMGGSFKSGNAKSATAFELTHATTAAGVNAAALKISGTAELKSDGTLVLLLSDTGAGDRYQLELTMIPSISENETRSTTSTDDQSVDDSTANTTVTTYTDTRTDTITKTSTISWSVGSLRKVVA